MTQRHPGGVLVLALISVLTANALSAAAPPASVIWLEAEQFADRGGWVNDCQFVDLMGSPYLLANAIGKPVADAVTQAGVAEAGTYRLWVRCRDWIPGHAPGTFQVVVAGKPSTTTFGVADHDRWHWVDGGAFELPAGKIDIRLHDLSGWWARCDAVVLSRDIRPSDDPAELAVQRERYEGVSAEAIANGPHDVVVVGGGLAGCAAAIAAARHGCSVALVQDRPMLGGNASREIRVAISGDTSNEPLDPRETGIIEELEPPGARGDRSSRYEEIVRGQPGIDLFFNTRATGVSMSNGSRISSVQAMDVNSGQRSTFAGHTFIDTTGDGWVGHWAGADYRTGREATNEYGDPAAAPEPHPSSLSTSLTGGSIVKRDHPVSFEAPAWAHKWDSCDDFDQSSKKTAHSKGDLPPKEWHQLEQGGGRHPDSPRSVTSSWWLEFGGMLDTITDAERIRDELLRIKVGLWDHQKNHCPQYQEAVRNLEFVRNGHIAGKRESRRLLGDYVLSQRDYMEREIHPDTVFYAGYNIDPHHPQGFWTKGPQAFRLYHYKVSVPYRVLYSRNIENLFMAGRNVSATHLGMNGIRVMRTTCIMGQIVGTAAGICKRKGTTPRGIYEGYVNELQQALLRDGCYLMGVRNADPEDCAREATVTASSFATIAKPGPQGKPPHGGTVHPLGADRAVMFTATKDHVEAIELYLASSRDTAVSLAATLQVAPELGDFSGMTQIAAATGAVPARSEGWVRFPLSAPLEAGRPYAVQLPATAGLSWHLYPVHIPGTARAYHVGHWTTMPHCYRFRLTPGGEPKPPTTDATAIRLVPRSVIDGWNRAVNGIPNSWQPDPDAPGPHWLELDFGEPMTIGSVHVTFQLPEMVARSFDVAIPDGNGWQVVHKVRDNALRRHVAAFDSVKTSRLRLIFPEAAGSPETVRVCEVRAYDTTTER